MPRRPGLPRLGRFGRVEVEGVGLRETLPLAQYRRLIRLDEDRHGPPSRSWSEQHNSLIDTLVDHLFSKPFRGWARRCRVLKACGLYQTSV